MNLLTPQQAEAIQRTLGQIGIELQFDSEKKIQKLVCPETKQQCLLVVKDDGTLWMCRGLKQNYRDWESLDNLLERLKKPYGYNMYISNLRYSFLVQPGFNLREFLVKNKVAENELKRALLIYNNNLAEVTISMPEKTLKAKYKALLKERHLIPA